MTAEHWYFLASFALTVVTGLAGYWFGRWHGLKDARHGYSEGFARGRALGREEGRAPDLIDTLNHTARAMKRHGASSAK